MAQERSNDLNADQWSVYWKSHNAVSSWLDAVGFLQTITADGNIDIFVDAILDPEFSPNDKMAFTLEMLPSEVEKIEFASIYKSVNYDSEYHAAVMFNYWMRKKAVEWGVITEQDRADYLYNSRRRITGNYVDGSIHQQLSDLDLYEAELTFNAGDQEFAGANLDAFEIIKRVILDENSTVEEKVVSLCELTAIDIVTISPSFVESGVIPRSTAQKFLRFIEARLLEEKRMKIDELIDARKRRRQIVGSTITREGPVAEIVTTLTSDANMQKVMNHLTHNLDSANFEMMANLITAHGFAPMSNGTYRKIYEGILQAIDDHSVRSEIQTAWRARISNVTAQKTRQQGTKARKRRYASGDFIPADIIFELSKQGRGKYFDFKSVQKLFAEKGYADGLIQAIEVAKDYDLAKTLVMEYGWVILDKGLNTHFATIFAEDEEDAEAWQRYSEALGGEDFKRLVSDFKGEVVENKELANDYFQFTGLSRTQDYTAISPMLFTQLVHRVNAQVAYRAMLEQNSHLFIFTLADLVGKINDSVDFSTKELTVIYWIKSVLQESYGLDVDFKNNIIQVQDNVGGIVETDQVDLYGEPFLGVALTHISDAKGRKTMFQLKFSEAAAQQVSEHIATIVTRNSKLPELDDLDLEHYWLRGSIDKRTYGYITDFIDELPEEMQDLFATRVQSKKGLIVHSWAYDRARFRNAHEYLQRLKAAGAELTKQDFLDAFEVEV